MAGFLQGKRCVRQLAGALAALFSSHAAIAQDVRPLPVSVAEILVVDETTITELYPGIAQTRRESRLGFEAGGRVAEVSVDVGDRVEEDDVLATLDLRSLNAQIEAAEASLAEAEASLRLAQATAGRQGELVDRGVSSRQSLDEVRANLAVAEGRVAAANARVEELRVRRDLSSLIAPYAGVITERFLDEGTIAAPGSPVLSMVEADVVEIRVGVPLARINELSPGETYDFIVSDASVRARLRASTGVLERATQTVSAVFDVVDGAVTPGAIARLSLHADVEAEGAWVPITALSEERRGLWNVLALTEPSGGSYQLEARVVDVVYTETERAYVRGAVASGDLIVASGRARVVEGVRVTPVEPAEATSLAQSDDP